MTIRGWTIRAVSAVAVTGAVAACGSSSSSSGNGIASKSPEQIVNAAVQAIDSVKSVHLSGNVQSNGQPLTIDLDILAGQGEHGTLSTNGLSFEVLDTGQTVYIKGSPGFWQHFGGKAAAQLLNGKWLKAPATGQFASFTAFTDIRSLFGKLLSSHGQLTKDGTSTVNGQKAVAITDKSHGGTLYVAATGKAYPLKVQNKTAGAGNLTFDRYNESVALTPPANAIDITKLQGK